MGRFLAAGLFLTAASALSAGDVADFVNLGFSRDSRYFMFGQHGVSEAGTPYASGAVVEVPGNAYAPDGFREVDSDRPIEPGSDGQGALFVVVEQLMEPIRRHAIDHLSSGRLLYLLLDGDEPHSSLSFRDFQTGTRYAVELSQSRSSGASVPSAEFHIEVTITGVDGLNRSYEIGRPGHYRQGVLSYLIERVLLAPDGRSLVFVIERREQDETGQNVRFMVETVRPIR